MHPFEMYLQIKNKDEPAEQKYFWNLIQTAKPDDFKRLCHSWTYWNASKLVHTSTNQLIIQLANSASNILINNFLDP